MVYGGEFSVPESRKVFRSRARIGEKRSDKGAKLAHFKVNKTIYARVNSFEHAYICVILTSSSVIPEFNNQGIY